MRERKIFITQFDKDRLEELIEVVEHVAADKRLDLGSLQEELERAQIVSSQNVPSKVVTMNSRVLLRDIDTSEEMTFTLVFPKDADIQSGLISVLAPVGTAILGYREGDVVEWPVPSGVRRISIEKILYQPEAQGDFDL
jgi:regulator of nucleoside diphosphate kinase